MRNVTHGMILGMINLKSKQKIALDTNIFICALNKNDSRHIVCLEILKQINPKDINAFISALVLEEFFIRIYKQNQVQNIPYLLDFITVGRIITILDINSKIALKAGELRAEYATLKTPDAIHLASAIICGASLFITADKKLPRKIGKLKVKVLT